jgi:hypothetical protein
VVVIRQVSASLAQAREDVSHKRAEVGDAFKRAEDEAAQGIGEVQSDISRVRRQLHVPTLPFLQCRHAD